jgi:hypothetical protein
VSDTPPTDREAFLREQANRWSRSETGWERRAGESLSAALLILDAQRDMDAWLAREVIKLREEVKSLRARLEGSGAMGCDACGYPTGADGCCTRQGCCNSD